MKNIIFFFALFYIFFAFGLTINPKSIIDKNKTSSILVAGNSETDIISAGGESATVSSIINTPVINLNTDGVQVFRFTIREGGSDFTDADVLPTIINSIKLTQNSGNSMNDWNDAIQSVALFDGITKIATGVLTATSITFSGAPLITVPDGGSATLTIRLSIQTSPNNSTFNNDGDDFVFSISKSNMVVSTTGSGLSAFSTVQSINGQNVFEVIATKLSFTTQPTTTSINATMNPAPFVVANDNNGNKDLDFNNNIAITSSGTMLPTTIIATASFGIGTFFNIVHTAFGTGFVLTATSTGLTGINSNSFDIINTTTLLSGDLAILAVNTNVSSGSDQIAFVCFQDILVGTQIFLTDNGYERVFAGKWGNTEGLISITRTGPTLVKGTIIVLETTIGSITTPTQFNMYSCGVPDNNWTKTVVGSFGMNKNDQIWIMQGGTWSNGTLNNHDATYNGNVLYGWSDSLWKTAINYNSTDGSTLYPKSRCFTTNLNSVASGQCYMKFNDPVNPDFSTTTRSKLDWIALFNNSLNWDTYGSNSLYNSGGYDYKGVLTCPTLTIAVSPYSEGIWTGKKDTNWFDCSNWQTLSVPDATTNVIFNNNSLQKATIVSTATDAALFGNIAKCKNLTISKDKLEIKSSANNKLEVYGDLTINNTSLPLPILDMSDGISGSADGNLYLYGNWNNLATTSEFIEGDSTVSFLGISPQIISPVLPDGTENFYNVILSNNHDTSISNNIIATGNLTLNTGKILTIPDDNYVSVNKVFTNNGTLNIANTGSFIQTENGFTNAGTNNNITKTTTPYEQYDYTYWSSPVVNSTIGSPFAAWRLDNAYRFQTSNFEDLFSGNSTPQIVLGSDTFDDDGDDWQPVTAATVMTPGLGYAIMAPTAVSFATPPTATVVFSGALNNGITPSISIDLSKNTIATDDDFNLVGNPYPSALNADEFIRANTLPIASTNRISGTLYFWTHKGDIQIFTTNPGPDIFNFNSNDYASYTLLGGIGTLSSGSGSPKPNGFIASGQGFMVESETASPNTLVFSNTMRSRLNTNNQFFRHATIQKDRIWLNLENTDGMFSQQLIGYTPESTLDYDYGFDGQDNKSQNYVSFYSFINNDTTKLYKIQGRSLFDVNDQIPLGYSSAVSGTTTISIDSSDGILNSSTTNVFLQDNLLNLTHDLKQAPYTFFTNYGTFNDRFILKYQDLNLNNTTFVDDKNALKIAVNDGKINVYSIQETILSIHVFDVLGRNIFENQSINAKTFTIDNLTSRNQALIIKLKLENGEIITRKVVL
jgi:hypothetical protein